jgi:effector-binding domain-containing protein
MTEMELVEVPDRDVACIRRAVAVDDLPEFFGDAFGAVAGSVVAAGGRITGPPFGWYHGVPGESIDVAAGFPISGTPDVPLGDDIEVVERPGGRAVVVIHVGTYDTLEQTYREAEAWIDEQGLVARDDMWEEYLSDPEEEPDPETWRTRLVVPVA